MSLRASTFSSSVTVCPCTCWPVSCWCCSCSPPGWCAPCSCQVPSSCWCRIRSPPAQPQVAHISSHLDREDLELLPAEHGHVRAAAGAQHDRRIGLEPGAAGPAFAPCGRLGYLQGGSFQAGALGGEIEAEPDRVD